MWCVQYLKCYLQSRTTERNKRKHVLKQVLANIKLKNQMSIGANFPNTIRNINKTFPTIGSFICR